ncbi:MAG: peptidylprolyl isomerase [Alphaproteobacteria bacterium]
MKFAPLASMVLTATVLVAAGGAVLAPSWAEEKPAAAQDQADSDPVIARVGDQELRASELAAQAQMAGNNLNFMPEEQKQAMLLDMTISMHLGAIAARRDGLDQTEDYKHSLAVIERQILYSSWLMKVSEEVASDEIVEKALKDNMFDIEVPVEIEARHILLETEDEARAIIKLLNDGGDFATLAAENSTGPTGKTGGGLGFFRHEQMVKPFADAAFDMKVGTLRQDPVQTQFGWHVIEVTDRRERADEAKNEIANRLLGEAIEKRMTDLRDEIGIEFVGPDSTTDEAKAEEKAD